MNANKKSARYNSRSPKFNKKVRQGKLTGTHYTAPNVRYKKPYLKVLADKIREKMNVKFKLSDIAVVARHHPRN